MLRPLIKIAVVAGGEQNAVARLDGTVDGGLTVDEPAAEAVLRDGAGYERVGWQLGSVHSGSVGV